ncbi:MAG: ECF transporter S component [Lachnoclostridium sp.]
MNKRTGNLQKLVVTAMLAAVAGVLMSLEISVPVIPPFYKVDFSDVPSIIAVFLLGPVSGMCVELIKILIKLLTVGTNTMYVGEFANLIGIVLFIVPLWFVYKRVGEGKKGIKIALAASVPIRIAFSCFVNAFITLPLYAAAMGMTMDQVVQTVGAVNPAIKNLPGFIIMATIPFNLLKNTLNCVVGYLLYERLKAAHVSVWTAKESA